jgi:manganese/zinc/iron transport system permease protein
MITLDYTLLIVGLGSTLLGLVSGVLGSFAVLRKQSLLGDAISHAALPGICLGFLVTMDKSPIFLILGAMVTGWIGALMVNVIVKNTVLKQDAALGVILSVFFGFGLVLLTLIQSIPAASQSGLDSFLFGSAATLLKSDVIVMSVLGFIVLTLTAIFWKEFKLISFDPEFASSLGLPTNKLDIFLNTLIVVAIVIGLQTVGVVLMSALIIAPAAAARQWTDNLARMVLLSGVFGALSGGIGALLSASIPRLPTGPTIVLTVSVCVFVSLLFAPNRGLLWGYIRHLKDRNNIRAKTMLANLRLFSERDTNPFHPHELSALTAIGRGPAKKAMKELKEKGFVVNPEGNLWALTITGLEKAKEVEIDMFGVADAIS